MSTGWQLFYQSRRVAEAAITPFEKRNAVGVDNNAWRRVPKNQKSPVWNARSSLLRPESTDSSTRRRISTFRPWFHLEAKRRRGELVNGPSRLQVFIRNWIALCDDRVGVLRSSMGDAEVSSIHRESANVRAHHGSQAASADPKRPQPRQTWQPANSPSPTQDATLPV